MRSWKIGAFLLTLCIPFLTRDLPLRAQEGKDEKKQGDRGKKDQEKGAEKGGAKGEKKGRREEKKQELKTYDLATQGVLGAPAKGGGDFYELTYTVTEGKKASKKKAWVKIDSQSQLRRDRLANVAEFKEGEGLHVFGLLVVREQGGKTYGGAGPPMRLLQASRVVIGGKDVSVNSGYKDPKDKKYAWHAVTVEKPGAGITVLSEGDSYKLSLDKPSTVIMREEGVLKRDVRRGAKIYFEGNAVSEKPAGEEEERPAFHAEQVLVIETRAGDWYKALLP